MNFLDKAVPKTFHSCVLKQTLTVPAIPVLINSQDCCFSLKRARAPQTQHSGLAGRWYCAGKQLHTQASHQDLAQNQDCFSFLKTARLPGDSAQLAEWQGLLYKTVQANSCTHKPLIKSPKRKCTRLEKCTDKTTNTHQQGYKWSDLARSS